MGLWITAAAGLAWVAISTGAGCNSGVTGNNNADMATSGTDDIATSGTGDMTTAAPDMASIGMPAFVKLTSGFRQPFSAVYDPTTSAWYVSNIDGTPSDPKSLKDGKAFITKIPYTAGIPGQPDHVWFTTGINAPTGIKLNGNKLYFADVDQLVVLDIAAKTTVRSSTVAPSGQAVGAGLPAFILDVTVNPADGAAYAIDGTGGRIIKFATPMTANNNGTIVGNQDDYAGPSSIYLDSTTMKLVITEAGVNQVIMLPGGFTTVGLNGMGKTSLVTTMQNNLAFAGCEKDNTDYLIGSPADKLVYRVNSTSGVKTAIQSVGGDGASGINDFGFDPATRTIAIPDAASNVVLFYKIP